MGIRSSQNVRNRGSYANKIFLGLVAAIATATISSAGIAAAQSFDTNNENDSQSFVTFCKQNYKQLGYKNIGQCISHHNGHGHGYGGGDNQGNDNDQGNEIDNGNNHFHFKFHNFFGGWWHGFERHF